MPEANRPYITQKLAGVSVRDQDGVSEAAITGELDVSNVDEIGHALIQVPNIALGLIVDLTALEYLDSSGIALLYDLAGRLRERSQKLIIVCPAGSLPRRVLELTGVNRQAPLLDDLDAAQQMMRDAAAEGPAF